MRTKTSFNTLEVDKEVARILYDDILVFDDKLRLMSTSQNRLKDSISSGWIGMDNTIVGEPVSFCLELPRYSCSIENAWLLVNKIIKKSDFYLDNYCKDRISNETMSWRANYKKLGEMWVSVEAETAPMAICLMFLRYHNRLERLDRE
jgi:hypothetical protein